MDVSNKYKFILPTTDKYINLPIELKWDFYGRDDSIEIFQEEVVEDIIGVPDDFEILRFAHDTYRFGNSFEDTKINYVGDWTSYNYRKAMQDGGYKEGDSLGGKMFPTLFEAS